jgi:predicted phosphodiesterase
MDSSNNLENFKESVYDRSPYKKKKRVHPQGFEPSGYFSEEKQSGEIVSSPQKSNNIDWNEQLESYFGKDAHKYQVVPGTAEIRFWDNNMGSGNIERFYYFKAKIVSSKKFMEDEDFKKLLNQTKKIKIPKKKTKLKKGKVYTVCISDLQIGKEGTEQTVERWMDSIPKIKDEIREIRKTEPIDQLLLAGLGDIVEGCTGFYPMQESSIILDHRQQQKVARRMVYTLMKELVPMFDKTIAAFIAGNHGEYRKNGKAYTSFGDNKDVMLLEELAEIFKESPDYKKKIDFLVPENDLSMTFELQDTIITLAHGHQMRSGGTNHQAKSKNWLANQSLARSMVADTDVLLMGHFHTFSVFDAGGSRLIATAPSLDSGSQWFDNVYGGNSSSGILTLVLGGEEKWSKINVIR